MRSSGFLGRYLRDPSAVGAIAPSSRALARAMCDAAGVDGAGSIAELGPGTGVFTREIRARLRSQARLLVVERDPVFAAHCREQFPDVNVVNAGAESLATLCDRAEMRALDAVISGIPWASLPLAVQRGILDALRATLRPGGVLVTFAYHIGLVLPAGRRFHSMLPEYFASVEHCTTVWGNLPPARVYRCTLGRSQ